MFEAFYDLNSIQTTSSAFNTDSDDNRGGCERHWIILGRDFSCTAYTQARVESA